MEDHEHGKTYSSPILDDNEGVEIPVPHVERRVVSQEPSHEAMRAAQAIYTDRRVYSTNAQLIRAHAEIIDRFMKNNP